MTKKSGAAAVAEVALGISIGPWAAEKIVGLFDKTEHDLDGKSADEVSLQLRHEQVTSEMLQARAKAAFEFALANRIVSAKEVEIEEYFEGSGSGGIGVNVNEKTLGAHGKGARITRRIVRLRGWPDASGVDITVDPDALSKVHDP